MVCFTSYSTVFRFKNFAWNVKLLCLDFGSVTKIFWGKKSQLLSLRFISYSYPWGPGMGRRDLFSLCTLLDCWKYLTICVYFHIDLNFKIFQKKENKNISEALIQEIATWYVLEACCIRFTVELNEYIFKIRILLGVIYKLYIYINST